MANKYMKRCSMSLVIREMQMKITMRYHFTRARMATVKTTATVENTDSVDRDVEKLELLCIADGTVKWCSCCGK